jgi:pimeloyl-ACP methyl ester carboxylesterase
MRVRWLGVLAIALSMGDRVMSQTPDPNQNALSTRMIDVDGRPIRVRTAGLDRRAARQPVVVFESGGSAPLETWDSILPAVAAFAPLVAYDRVGTGQSPWDSLPQTPERIVARLKRLLATMKVAPPYLLVGHSWGGALIRYFGGASPADIAGMIYLDPTDITQTRAQELTVYEAAGANAAARDSFYNIMERAMTNAPPALRSEGAVTMSIFKQDLVERKLPPAPSVPTTVILAGRPASLPQAGLPFDVKRFSDAAYADRVQRLKAWAREPGQFIVAANSGHMVHVTEPQLVIDAVRRHMRQ